MGRMMRRLAPIHILVLVAWMSSMASAEESAGLAGENASASAHQSTVSVPYLPTAENLAAREWFQDAKFGIFIHWGVYSVLGRGEWVMQIEKISNRQYEKLPPQFNPAKYDADEWVALFKRSGARYVTITSKHHDGFAMWDSKASDWDIVDRTPYQRDVLKQLADECRRQDMKLFFYHSQLDWHHPDYFPRGMTGQASGRPDHGDWNKYLDYMDRQLGELLSGDYGQVAGIWFDGWWDQQTKRFKGHENADPLDTKVDWRLRRTYDKIHALQPACLIGANHHVAPFEGEDFQMFERDLPGENKGGHSHDATIGSLPLETCDTINGAWGYNAGDKTYKSLRQLIHYLVQAAGRNANFLLNIGPRPDGTIDPEMVRRLEGIGEWLSQYGHTIYGSRGGPTGPQPWGTSTQTADAIYLHILDSSAADSAGWLTLSGTESLETNDVRDALDSNAIESRRDADGQLQVKVLDGSNPIDRVLRIAKSAGG
jgi:alpha-L-fucosidase